MRRIQTSSGRLEPGYLDEPAPIVRPREQGCLYNAPVLYSDYELLNRVRGPFSPWAGRHLTVDVGQVRPAVGVGMVDYASRLVTFQTVVESKKVFRREDVRRLDASARVRGMRALVLHVYGRMDLGHGPIRDRAAEPAAALAGKRGAGVFVDIPEHVLRDVGGG